LAKILAPTPAGMGTYISDRSRILGRLRARDLGAAVDPEGGHDEVPADDRRGHSRPAADAGRKDRAPSKARARCRSAGGGGRSRSGPARLLELPIPPAHLL